MRPPHLLGVVLLAAATIGPTPAGAQPRDRDRVTICVANGGSFRGAVHITSFRGNAPRRDHGRRELEAGGRFCIQSPARDQPRVTVEAQQPDGSWRQGCVLDLPPGRDATVELRGSALSFSCWAR
jgi:hypothetical protein